MMDTPSDGGLQPEIDLSSQWAMDYRRVDQAIRFLNDHYLEHPSLETVAAQVHLSVFHFERLFQRWAGTSPKRFMQFLTKQHAQDLLRRSGTLLDVAHSSGLSGTGRLHDLFVTCEAATPGEWKYGGQGVVIRYGRHVTPFGECFLGLTDRGICDLRFLDGEGGEETALAELRREWPCAVFKMDTLAAGALVEQIFSPATLQKPKFHLHVRGTNFQIKVWEALMRVPFGTLVTYSQLAAAVGHSQAQRAVGTAVGKNPVAYLIPCHRVIQRMGGFGNYRWSPSRKQALIGWESSRNTP